jgi:hypothetical protein
MLDEQRQVPGMVKMSMGENDGIDPPGLDRERRPVPKPERLESLEQAAIDEQAMVTVLDQKFRAGHGAGTA